MSAPQATVSKLDVVSRFGREAPAVGIHFAKLETAGSFVRCYAFNMNKSVRRNKGGGDYKKWLCSEHEKGCSWFVALTRKRKSTVDAGTAPKKRKKPKTKFSHIPEGSWYISKMQLEHSPFCSSTAKMTSEYLMEQPGFIAATVEGHSTSFARVANNMKTLHGVDMTKQQALAYRTIQQAKRKKQVDPVAEYGRLPSFLKTLASQNEGSRVCCQLDSQGRFFRAFLAFGSIVRVQDALIPVFECDGTHMKNPLYNGVCLSLVDKDGNKQNVPIAVAYVHKETVDNFAWFFGNCIVAGVKMHDRPTFSDRGKQLGAQELLARLGMSVHVKFCSVHIRFNTMDRFKSLKLKMESVKDDILSLQGTSTTTGFDHVVSTISKRYPSGISKVVAGKTVVDYVWSYLHGIHPTDWCVVGNMQPTPVETSWLKDSWCNVAKHGDPLPLFGVRSTSAAEGENNGLLWKGVRSKLVLGSMMAYCVRVLEVVRERNTLLSTWMKAECDVTPYALELFDDEKRLVPQQNVVVGKPPILYVFDAFDSRSIDGDAHLYEVDMERGSCTRCTVAEQMKVPCRHIQAVAFWRSRQKDSDLPKYDVKTYFHPCYSVPKLHDAFESIAVRLPLYEKLAVTNEVREPPLYRQGGRSLVQRKETTDFVRGKKRTKNRGECAGVSSRATHSTPATASATAAAGDDDESKQIAEFFASQLTGPQSVKRDHYHCTRCGQEGHNTRSCTTPLGEVEEAGVGIVAGVYIVGECPFALLAGVYIVGECPFALLGHQAAYEQERKKYL